ncbi:MAG TPA: hypothetical protein VL096_13975 [Pirellulaceae bacterium]|nr:hypothetical protein [Pirellulaceae bacterium]
MATNVWPDFSKEATPRGMRKMLEELCAGLETKTRGLVRANVSQVNLDDDEFRYTVELDVPQATFQYPLLTVQTGIGPFPAKIVWSGGDFVEVDKEEGLAHFIKVILESERTRELIKNLMALATE